MLRTYALGEADRIVVFLTRDRGKKRGVAANARRSRRRFGGTLEPLTEVRVEYREHEQHELVRVHYAELVRSPLGAPTPEALSCSAYFAELLDACAPEGDADERLFRLGAAALDALVCGAPPDPLARYFECWLLRLQGIYPVELDLSAGAAAFVAAARRLAPHRVGDAPGGPAALRELEAKHRALLAAHLDGEPRSLRVLRELREAE